MSTPWNAAFILVLPDPHYDTVSEAHRLLALCMDAGIAPGRIRVATVGTRRRVPGAADQIVPSMTSARAQVTRWCEGLATSDRGIFLLADPASRTGHLRYPVTEAWRWGVHGLGERVDFTRASDATLAGGLYAPRCRPQVMGDSDGLILWKAGDLEWIRLPSLPVPKASRTPEVARLFPNAVPASTVFLITTDEPLASKENIIGFVGIGDAALRGGKTEEWAFVPAAFWCDTFRLYPANEGRIALMAERFPNRQDRDDACSWFSAFDWQPIGSESAMLLSSPRYNWLAAERRNERAPAEIALVLRLEEPSPGVVLAGPWYGTRPGPVVLRSAVDEYLLFRKRDLPPKGIFYAAEPLTT